MPPKNSFLGGHAAVKAARFDFGVKVKDTQKTE
jgi:hypothetical protein